MATQADGKLVQVGDLTVNIIPCKFQKVKEILIQVGG